MTDKSDIAEQVEPERESAHYLEKIIAKLRVLDDEGSKRLESGTLLIAKKKTGAKMICYSSTVSMAR